MTSDEEGMASPMGNNGGQGSHVHSHARSGCLHHQERCCDPKHVTYTINESSRQADPSPIDSTKHRYISRHDLYSARGIMEALTIRPRDDSDDVPALLPLLQRVYHTHRYPIHGLVNTEFLASHAIEHSWVAISNDQIVGNISVSRATMDDPSVALWKKLHPEDDLAVLGRLFVDPDVAGKGIAKQLLSTVMAWALQRQTRLVLFVLQEYGRLESLYAKAGWIKYGASVYVQPDGASWNVMCYASPLAEEKP
nr:hypothetical protein CFP56_21232 [Quercus suber]